MYIYRSINEVINLSPWVKTLFVILLIVAMPFSGYFGFVVFKLMKQQSA